MWRCTYFAAVAACGGARTGAMGAHCALRHVADMAGGWRGAKFISSRRGVFFRASCHIFFKMNSLIGMASTVRLPTVNGVSFEPEALRGRLSNVRGPRDFFDLSRTSRPQGLIDAQSRIGFNLSYFATNYMLIILALGAYSLLTNLMLLFVIVLAGAGFVGIGLLQGQDLVLPWGTIITSQSLYLALGIITVPLFIIASPLSTLFWLVGASALIVLGHAAIMEKPLASEFGGSEV